jgi:uncharacterized protein YqjF (DUF2071 family)
MSPAICGHMRWRSLLFLHWRVPARDLERTLPAGLELDLHDGAAYVSLLPFAMEGVRPVFVPEFLSVRTLETNVRTYVKGPGGEPGIFFYSLDAESLRAVAGGRIGFGLPYHFAVMRMAGNGLIEYAAERRSGSRPRLRVTYRVGDRLGDSLPGSPEHFLVERYVLFVRRRAGLFSCRVRHVPYPLHAVDVLSLEDSLVSAAGMPQPDRPPDRAHWSPGVDVEVEWPRAAGR